MSDLLFPTLTYPVLPTPEGGYPVHRIFCVGRNYVAHAAEMGNEVDREAPFYFMKDAQAVVLSGGEVPYPPGTQDYHHEMELVVALGGALFHADAAQAAAAVWGYGCGLDMTRRDLQGQAKDRRRSWDLGKNFEQSAILGPLAPRAHLPDPGACEIRLRVNGAMRQQARLSEMVWSVPEILSHLSGFYHLRPGDIVMTGTPAGVGPVRPGDLLEGEIDGLAPVRVRIGAPVSYQTA